jgi:sec-independent protein translocase protein TatA
MNVFGIGLPELAVIAAIALLVFGPKRLPEFGKTLGRTLKGFQSASSEFEREFRASLVTPDLDPGDERSLTQAAAPVAQPTAVAQSTALAQPAAVAQPTALAQQASVNPVADPQPVQSPAVAAGDDPSGSADPPAALPVGDVSPLA